MSGLQEYSRPAPTEDEVRNLMLMTRRIILSNEQTRIKVISVLLLENLSLTKEVNAHRERLGYMPLPAYPINLQERRL